MKITKDLLNDGHIERNSFSNITINDNDGGQVKSQTVEAHLLLEILKELRYLSDRVDHLERTAHGIRVNTGL